MQGIIFYTYARNKNWTVGCRTRRAESFLAQTEVPEREAHRWSVNATFWSIEMSTIHCSSKPRPGENNGDFHCSSQRCLWRKCGTKRESASQNWPILTVGEFPLTPLWSEIAFVRCRQLFGQNDGLYQCCTAVHCVCLCSYPICLPFFWSSLMNISLYNNSKSLFLENN